MFVNHFLFCQSDMLPNAIWKGHIQEALGSQYLYVDIFIYLQMEDGKNELLLSFRWKSLIV